ncbi:hypothetical protein [Arenimonas sp.]|uniref:hypothetical protein n=1 Tax=Arenimonas sp. TaxID=1872635 RepID=UPI0025C24D27|nr:hypothetical protein [Arenimonas sp.]
MIPALLLALQLAAAPSGFSEAKALADANEAALSSEMMSRLMAAQGELLGEAVGKCAGPGMDFSPLAIVFVLNEDGSVARTWRQGDTPLATCLEREFAAATFSGRWPAPFYTSIELSLAGH